MAKTLYLLVFLVISQVLVVYTNNGANVETNFLHQMERESLINFWRRDMEYIINFMKNTTLPPYTSELSYFTKCQLHRFMFKNFTLHTYNVNIVLDPGLKQITFSQPIGLDFTIQFFWEVNVGFFPISGSATFSGQVINLIYTLNMTQPYEGDMLIPSIDGTWNVTSYNIKCTLGNIFGIYDTIKKMFGEAILGPVMDDLMDDIMDEIPLMYKEFYKPHTDIITFSGLENYEVEVMRRYKRFYMDVREFAVVYQETIPHTESEVSNDSPIIPAEINLRDTHETTGVKRRYMREVTVFEQIASKLMSYFDNFLVEPKDLPINQTMKLDSKSMEIMIPNFTKKYGEKANISLMVSGESRILRPLFEPYNPTMVKVSDIIFKLEWYVVLPENDTCFLNATIKYSMLLKPYCFWQNGNIVHNLEIKEVYSQVLSAESIIFGKDINIEGIRKYTSLGLYELLKGRCEKNILGDGFKIRDEYGNTPNIESNIDVSGRLINTWIFKKL